jgi:hypothetical protein
MAKPIPIPLLDEESWAEFERQMAEQPTALEKDMAKRSVATFNKTKRKR